MTAERKVYTVSEITRGIKTLLEEKFPAVWVEGEISNLRAPFSGHRYFSLKDEASQLRAVLFKNSGREIKFELKDGLAVVCFGRIGVYEPSGQYQLYVERIEPRGLGALQLAFEQLKKKLAQEGLFDPARKKPLPVLPRRIGVVTSPTGAAIRDILRVLKRRFANVEVVINPVRVQGEGAAGEIGRAIEEFNRLGGIDVLIVGRGGGSIEDLWAFNEEVVARSIARSRIPVISAVGHEIDWTIADFVADLRAPTPSAAAELVVREKKALLDEIAEYRQRLSQAAAGQFARREKEAREFNRRLRLCHPLNVIRRQQQRLDELGHRLRLGHPSNLIRQQRQRLDELSRRFRVRLRHYLEMKQAAFGKFAEKLAVLSPLNVLVRGYSITFTAPEGAVVRDAGTLRPGREVRTRLGKGGFLSEVKEVFPEGGGPRDEKENRAR